MARPSATAAFPALRASLLALGHFRRGSLVRRFMPCGKPGCRCQADPPQLHGPYYQWTRKVRGKTVTVRLNRQQASAVRGWIETGRRIDRLLRQREQASLKATELVLRQLAQPRERGASPSDSLSLNRSRHPAPDR